MEEDWYTVEQQVRDRLTEARAAARIWTLTPKLAPTARHLNVVGITIIRLANWVLARAMRSPVDPPRALADVTSDDDTLRIGSPERTSAHR
jgi:hypothetical protein